METIASTTQQQLLYIALIGAGVGVLLGLIPLILAIRKGKTKLGVIAMVSSIVAGVAALLSIGIIVPLVVNAVFVWVILKKGPAAKPDASADASGSTPS
jgi:hypothetical protein